MNVILLGPPGSGKGTQASKIITILDVPHISTGDLVRKEIETRSELGKTIKEYSNQGKLVPDRLVIQLLEKRLDNPDSQRGFVLDGFPRTMEQAKALDTKVKIDLVINLNIPDEVIIQRLTNRIFCKKCGATYNRIGLPPRRDNICDECGSELSQRDDDKADIIRERLKVYREKTEPLTEFYKERGLLKDVRCDDLMVTPEVVFNKIKSIIKNAEKETLTIA